MRLPTRERTRLRSEDSMTPLIDVVFLLLIFFVCASIGQEAESLLPTPLAEGSVTTPDPTLVSPVTSQVWVYLATTEDGNVSLRVEQRECANFAELAENLQVLAEVTPESPVILDIGPEVPLELLVDVWDVSQRAGFESVSFAASSRDASG